MLGGLQPLPIHFNVFLDWKDNVEALCDKGSGFSMVESYTVCSCMLGRKHQCWECRQDKQASDKGCLCWWAESEQPRGLSTDEKEDLTELYLRRLLPRLLYHVPTQLQSIFIFGLSQCNTKTSEFLF